jgi:hypothetical protein
MAQPNTIQQAVSDYESRIGTPFKPTTDLFYKKVNINQKRFGQLLRGEKEPVTSELKALSNFFNVPIANLI